MKIMVRDDAEFPLLLRQRRHWLQNPALQLDVHSRQRFYGRLQLRKAIRVGSCPMSPFKRKPVRCKHRCPRSFYRPSCFHPPCKPLHPVHPQFHQVTGQPFHDWLFQELLRDDRPHHPRRVEIDHRRWIHPLHKCNLSSRPRILNIKSSSKAGLRSSWGFIAKAPFVFYDERKLGKTCPAR